MGSPRKEESHASDYRRRNRRRESDESLPLLSVPPCLRGSDASLDHGITRNSYPIMDALWHNERRFDAKLQDDRCCAELRMTQYVAIEHVEGTLRRAERNLGCKVGRLGA